MTGLPSFPMFPSDWLGCPFVAEMTLEQRGLYLELLMRQWQLGALPAAEDRLARLVGLDVDHFRGLWALVSRMFERDPDTAELRNPKLARIREEREGKYQRRVDASAKANAARWKASESESESESVTDGPQNQNQNQNQSRRNSPDTSCRSSAGADKKARRIRISEAQATYRAVLGSAWQESWNPLWDEWAANATAQRRNPGKTAATWERQARKLWTEIGQSPAAFGRALEACAEGGWQALKFYADDGKRPTDARSKPPTDAQVARFRDRLSDPSPAVADHARAWLTGHGFEVPA